MELTPINDRIVVEPTHQDNVTQAGLYIPESAKEVPMTGRIVYVGKGGYLESGEFRVTQLKVGDEVLFGRYAGSEIKLNGKDYLIMLETDIFGILGSDHPVSEGEPHTVVEDAH